MSKIIFIHQGFELYGSDRCFLETVAAAVKLEDTHVEAVIPSYGTLFDPLKEICANSSVKNLWILRRADLKSKLLGAIFTFPRALWQAFKHFRAANLVYINTAVVLDHILIARLFSKKAIIHLHEVPEGITLKLFQGLIRFSRADIIFNSHYTKTAYPLHPSQKSTVIYNGIVGSRDFSLSDYDGVRPLRLLILGRINRMKGQDVTLEAMSLLPPNLRSQLHLSIVGSVFGEDQSLLDYLKTKVTALNLENQVTFQAFIADPRPLIREHDVIIMPSIGVETLGRVAIEAQSEGRAVIVSNIGGLPETLVHEKTGFKITANSATELADSLRFYLENPQKVQEFGLAGLNYYEENFTQKTIDQKMHMFLKERLDDHV